MSDVVAPSSPTSASTKASAKRDKKSQRKKLYQLHSWLGFHLALLMSLILLTGTIATVSNEIDWIFQDDMRVTPGEAHVPWGEMGAAVHEYAPERNILSIQSMGGDYLAYRARVADEFGNQSFVHIDQWTGEVTGETHPFTVQRFFRDLHRYLFMPGVIALPIVCSMSFVLLISLYTGLKTSRNWRTLMTRIRFDKGARILWGDAHKAAGLWSIWFFIVIAITGIWYLLEWGYGVAGTKMVPDRPSVVAERVIEFGEVINDRPVAEIVASAKTAYPELQIASIQYPGTTNGTFTVLGFDANPLLRERANMVFVDPEDASVIEVLTEHDLPLDTYLNEMADPLHFGNFAGLTSKLIWFVFGVFMTGLSFTGVWLTWKRLRSKRVTRTQLATTPILLAATILGYFYVDRYLDETTAPAGETLLAKQEWTAGSTAQLAINTQAAQNASAPYRLLLETTGRPNLANVEFCVDGECVVEPVRSVRGAMSIEIPHDRFGSSDGTNYRAILRFQDETETSMIWR
ncbi:MAG: PepSY-associated TM helix domain-containing protein [Pseudomonadota bacterium]